MGGLAVLAKGLIKCGTKRDGSSHHEEVDATSLTVRPRTYYAYQCVLPVNTPVQPRASGLVSPPGDRGTHGRKHLRWRQ